METQGMLQKQVLRLVGGVEISYLVGGVEGGPAVVLLHGGGTDHALLSWGETLPVLMHAGYRVYAPNQPGYGDSPADEKPSTMENLVGYVTELMNLWGLQQAALVGVSMGAGMALGYTLAHPERVSRLVLVGAYGIQDRAPYHALSYFLVRMPRLMDGLWAMMRGWRWAAEYSLGSILRNPQARTQVLVDEVFKAMQNPGSQRAFGQFQRDEIEWAGMKTNYTPRLSEIQAPALLVHGSRDVGVPLKYARRAAGYLPHARLEVFEGAGHWTQRDQLDRFNRLLLEFLSQRTTR